MWHAKGGPMEVFAYRGMMFSMRHYIVYLTVTRYLYVWCHKGGNQWRSLYCRHQELLQRAPPTGDTRYDPAITVSKQSVRDHRPSVRSPAVDSYSRSIFESLPSMAPPYFYSVLLVVIFVSRAY